jgi:hypothetical protein
MKSFKKALDTLKGKYGYLPISDEDINKGYLKVSNKHKDHIGIHLSVNGLKNYLKDKGIDKNCYMKIKMSEFKIDKSVTYTNINYDMIAIKTPIRLNIKNPIKL